MLRSRVLRTNLQSGESVSGSGLERYRLRDATGRMEARSQSPPPVVLSRKPDGVERLVPAAAVLAVVVTMLLIFYGRW